VTAPDVHLSIIVPVRNGEARLPDDLRAIAEFRRTRPFPTEIVLVDDGSEAPAARILDGWGAQDGFVLVRNEVHSGKGRAVRRGLLAARGAFRILLDADLSYPLEEITKVLAALEAGSDVVVACRVHAESRYVMSPVFFRYLYTRHLLSRIFNALVRHTVLPDILDSQAGLKGLTGAAAERVVPKLTIAGFAFDVELLYVAHLHGLRMRQVPVTFRYDSEPTTVRFVADGWRMVRDLATIRSNGIRGRYA
jgi:dolichyl-phosphate beta-glucosyltransferase